MSNSTVSELAALPGLEGAKRLALSLATTAGAGQAVLLYGMQGSGKSQLASTLAKAYLCTRSGPEGACGECQACQAFERGRSADFLFLDPAPPSRWIRSAAVTPPPPQRSDDYYPVDAQTFLRTPPLAARSKVVLLQDVDRLFPDAANAFLKTLEEPPAYTRFILTTEAVGTVLPTILSRCVAVACELPQGDEADWADRLALGAPFRAAFLREYELVYRPLADFAAALPRRHPHEALVFAEEFSALASTLEDARKLTARAANAEALYVLSIAYSQSPDARAEALQLMIEAHRRVVGNANAGSTLDALFAQAVG